MIHEANCSQPPESNSDRIVPQGPTSGPQRSVPMPWILGKTYAISHRKNSQVTLVQFFTSEELEKKVLNDLSDVKFILWRQIQLDILQKRGALQPHSVSGHQSQVTNRSTPLAGLSRNIDIGLQSQKVIKSFPGLAHHRRRKNTILCCNEIYLVWRINFIWVSAWSCLYRSPYILLPTGHDTRSYLLTATWIQPGQDRATTTN